MNTSKNFSYHIQSGADTERKSDGTVNLDTKSGGNVLHGSAYYYNRNEFYSAKSPFFTPAPGTKAPPLRNQNYGFQVNGPIRKDKAFFLASFEKQQYIIGLSGVATEPSDAWVTLATDLLNNPLCAPVTPTCTTRKYGSYNPISPSSVSATLIAPTGFSPRSGRGTRARPSTV